MYAIVDIETTGGFSRNERITEIAIVLFDGEKVTEEFSTLINPEKPIPYRITQLTGIDNQMVQGAPKFYEVAKRVYQMTENKLFIAHNVSFDYNFIRNEFESLGGEFKRKKLCTVQMSRKLISGQRSYSLGKLCVDLGIENKARHRALGDAKATTELFKYLLSLDGMNREDLFTGSHLRELNTRVDLAILRDLPEATGVYYFFNSNDELIYVGKSVHIKSRVIDHLNNNGSAKAIQMKQQIARIDYFLSGSELVALLKESEEIKKHQPLYNRSQRRTYYTYGIVSGEDDSGYRTLKVERLSPKTQPLISFSTKLAAREYLFRLVEKHELCQRICGLYASSGPCFHYSIQQCRGACCEEESNDEYNYRVHDAISELSYTHRDFVILDKGRSVDEKSVILIRNGVYEGFGFLNESVKINHPSEFTDHIDHYQDNRDVQQIIRSYLNQKRVEQIVPIDTR